MSAMKKEAVNVQVEIMKTRQELKHAEDMMKYVDDDFFESHYLLVESLRSRLCALIRTAKQMELGA